MALIVEDGTIVAGANSYINVADADVYFSQHPYATNWNAATTDQKTNCLIYATQTIDTYITWFGERVTSEQPLKWPRYGMEDEDGNDISTTTIPQDLIKATSEQALASLAGDRTAESDQEGLTGLKVDAIQLNWSENHSHKKATLTPLVGNLLRIYGRSAESRSRTVVRT